MTTPSTQETPLSFSFDENSLIYVVSLALSIGLIYLFCRRNFGERISVGNDDYVSQLLPRQLATPEEYTRGFLIYLATMVGAVLLLSLLGPQNLKLIGITLPPDTGKIVIPLALALLVTGLVPNVPVLHDLECWLRQFALERAYIPAAARATAERLSAADFDFSSYSGDALQSPEMRGVEQTDFARSRRTLEHDWARLSCLIYELKWRRMSGAVTPLDVGLLQSYERDLDSIEDKRNAIESEVARYRAEKAVNAAYANDVLHRSIRSSLYKLYILLACAVRFNKQPHDDIDLALRPFGFRLNHAQGYTDNRDLLLVGMVIVAGCILVLGFAAVSIARLHLWSVTEFFPQTWYEPFLNVINALILYVAAIGAADFVRSRRITNGSWLASSSAKRRANVANYVRIAIPCAMIGYVSLVIWGMAEAPITLTQLKMQAPYALLSAVTGAFYAYHLDNVELEQRPSRLREVALQTFATAICALIAATVSFAILFAILNIDDNLPCDKILFTAVVGGAAGAALAWYIPQAAASGKNDPLSIARDERVRALEVAAGAHFGDPGRAVAWLDRPHPVLNNTAPKAAAADVEGFERAISLLEAPQPLAA